MAKLTNAERERLRALNKKNNEFNDNLWNNARSYSKSLFLFSLLVLIVFIAYLIFK